MLRMRKLRVSLIFASGVLLLIAGAGYCYDRLATSREKAQYPFKGQLVDLGSFRLHLYCTGAGKPTVLLDAGAFDSLEQWALVQPQVAKFTQVCSYDRPGVGYSDPSPDPQTSRNIAQQLDEALVRAGISAPYLPVGHSIAGLYARVFASRFRDRVAGLVLEDSVHPNELNQFPTHFPNHPVLFTALRLTAPFGAARLLHIGCRQTGAHPDCSKFVVNLMRQMSVLRTSYAEAGEVTSLGRLPVVVITHDPHVGLSKVRNEREEEAWSQWQEDLAKLSSRSTLVMVSGVGHEIQTEKPEIVVNEIERLVMQWRDLNE
jgi:pimeloyl-ACP methyl ester carboxylesterase